MNKFIVVEFVHEKTVEVVRENWLETSDGVIIFLKCIVIEIVSCIVCCLNYMLLPIRN